MSLISISNLTFKYDAGSENVFENVSCQFDTDWRLGLIGRNGRGKTTLLKLLMGEYEYYGSIASPMPFSYFPFPADRPERASADVLGELCLGCGDWELRRELNTLRLPDGILDRPFDTLSGGERTKAMIAALFLRKNNFLLLDEPTNHLDWRGKEAMAGYLGSKKGFILVSHDRAFLDRTVDHILSINRAGVEIQHGGFSQWQFNRERQDASEAAQNIRIRHEISRLKAAARRTADWSDRVEATKIGSGSADRGAIGHKAAKMMKRSKNIERRRNEAIEVKSSLLKNIEMTDDLKISPLAYHSETLAELSGVSVEYGGRRVFGEMNLTVRRGGRIALIGGNGCGKSSLIKLVAGREVPHSGEVKIGGGLKISYAPQETGHLRGGLREFAGGESADMPLFLAILHKLGFEKWQFDGDMRDFSDGQKKKALIAKSLSERAHLYIWDEPLNYIDIQSRVQIEKLLTSCAPTMLFVEHDEMFVKNVATEVMTMD